MLFVHSLASSESAAQAQTRRRCTERVPLVRLVERAQNFVHLDKLQPAAKPSGTPWPHQQLRKHLLSHLIHTRDRQALGSAGVRDVDHTGLPFHHCCLYSVDSTVARVCWEKDHVSRQSFSLATDNFWSLTTMVGSCSSRLPLNSSSQLTMRPHSYLLPSATGNLTDSVTTWMVRLSSWPGDARSSNSLSCLARWSS